MTEHTQKSTVPSTATRLLSLLKNKEVVSFGDPPDQMNVVVWKPTLGESDHGRTFLNKRIKHWSEEKEEDAVDQTKAILDGLAESEEGKKVLIEQILKVTVQDRVQEAFDLLEPKIRKDMEAERLYNMSPEMMRARWGLKPIPRVEDQIEQTKIRTGRDTPNEQNIGRDDLTRFVEKPEEMREYLDALLLQDIEGRYLDDERASYMQSSMQDLATILSGITRQQLAMEMALEEWVRLMLVYVCREEGEGNNKGARIFAQPTKEDPLGDPDAVNYIGNYDDTILEPLAKTFLEITKATTSARGVRGMAGDPGFTKSAKSPNPEASPRPVAVESQTS